MLCILNLLSGSFTEFKSFINISKVSTLYRWNGLKLKISYGDTSFSFYYGCVDEQKCLLQICDCEV
jgi:hypothetical protein